MSQNTSQKPLQRIILILCSLAFFGSTVFGMAGLFTSNTSPAKTSAGTTEQEKMKSVTSQLKAQEQGFETVLKREPNNQAALAGLVQLRLQMNNLQGTVEPLEKLVQLNPNRSDYQALLTEVKKQASQPTSSGKK